MAVFSVEINDADVVRVLDAVSANYNRPDQVQNPDYDLVANPDFDDSLQEDPETNPSMISNGQDEYIDNPETKAQFANRKVRDFLSDHVKAYEVQVAKHAAIDALNTTIEISDPAV